MNLSKAEIERLAILSEECAEVQQIVGKILRHGFESFNPFDEQKVTNRKLLERELGDLSFAINFCHDNKDINLMNVMPLVTEKKENIKQYLHFNKIKNED